MAKKVSFQLPLWLPVDAWRGYLLMRKQVKKPLTEYGMKLAIRRLEELMAQGHSATAVLEQSIFNSWQGLFEINRGNGHAKAASVGKGPEMPFRCRPCGETFQTHAKLCAHECNARNGR